MPRSDNKPVKKIVRSGAQAEEASGAADWMTTYCDMVTLLFAFFVLLFALSQVDSGRFDVFVFALSERDVTAEEIMQFGLLHGMFTEDAFDPYEQILLMTPPAASSMEEAYEIISEHIARSGMSDLVTAYLGDDFIFIRFLDEMLFAPNSAVIQPRNLDLLNHIGMSLRAIEGDVGMIRIDGHTATVPGQEAFLISDRDLSSQRANAVLRYFEDVVGIDGEVLRAMAFGRFRPIADNYTEEERRLNRRIEIMVTQADVVALQLDNIYERMVERR